MVRCQVIDHLLSYGEGSMQGERWLPRGPATRYKSPLNEAGGHGESVGS